MNMIKITETQSELLDMYAPHSESVLKHYFEPEQGIFIAESTKVIERAINTGYEPLSLLMYENDTSRETCELFKKCREIPIFAGNEEDVVGITGFKLIRGPLCAMRRKALPSAEELCRDKKRVAVLENVVNPANIGAIFRSAAALGFDAVLLTSDCSDPLYRRSLRVSMGTVFQIPWTFFSCSTVDYPSLLRSSGFASAAMALRNDTVDISDTKLNSEEKLAVIMGSEGEGLSDSTIEACDYTIKIPMFNGVDSLNVAAASAVAFWQLGIRNGGNL